MILCFVPFRGLISGPSNSGKTYFILRMLQNRQALFSSQFDRIIYCHPHGNVIPENDVRLFEQLEEAVPSIDIRSELPNIADLQSYKGTTLLILEDMIGTIVESAEHMRLYTIFSSHCAISIITTTQNYFEQGKYSKTIARNQTFIVLFESRNDRQATAILSSKIFPGQGSFLNDCFAWLATNVPDRLLRYLLLDCSTSSSLPSNFPQVRTNIMKEFQHAGPILLHSRRNEGNLSLNKLGAVLN